LFELGSTSESGGSLSRRAGTLLAELGNDGAWGVGGLFVFDEDPDEVIRLGWAKGFGALQIGVQYRRNWNDIDSWRVSLFSTYETIDNTFGLGARWELAAQTYIDVAADLLHSYRVIYFDGAPEFGGSNTESYSTRMRLFHGISDRTVIVPLLRFRRALHPEYVTEYRNFFDKDLRDLGLGLGWNHLPDSDTMLVGSFTYGHASTDLRNPRLYVSSRAVSETRHSYMTRFGVERRMLSWLTLRAGVWQLLGNCYTDIREEAGGAWSHDAYRIREMDLSLGLAVHVGPFDADMVFNDSTPFNVGGFFAPTDGNAGTTWNKITLQYVF